MFGWGFNTPSVKQQVINLIKSMPDNVTVDDVMEELYFKLRVDAGLKELNKGKNIPHKNRKEIF